MDPPSQYGQTLTPKDNDYDLFFFYLNLPTQSADAFTKVTAFLGVFLRRDFQRFYSYCSYVRIRFFFLFLEKDNVCCVLTYRFKK